jgi:RNA polymerase sigma factor (sigma-70 family)
VDPAQDDETLIVACLARDERAWNELIGRYRRLVYSIPFAYRMSSDEAGEIFSAVMLKLFKHLGALRNRSGLASWLIVTTRRECISYRRSASRFSPLEEGADEELPQDPDDVVQELHEIACEHTLALAFKKMDPICHGLLEALYLEEPTPSYKELSVRLKRPVGSLGPTRSRCLAKLREIYTSFGGKEP